MSERHDERPGGRMLVGYDSPKPKRRLVDDDGDGYGGREPRHPGDCPATLSYGHDTHTRGCVEYTPLPPVPICAECRHPAGAHAEVTNDGCFIEDCLCERRESETAVAEPKSPFAERAEFKRRELHRTHFCATCWASATLEADTLALALHAVKGGGGGFAEAGTCECVEDAAAIVSEYGRLVAGRL